MRNSSRLQTPFWAACLLSLCFGGCSKDKKTPEAKPEASEKVTAAAETKPAANTAEAPKSATGALAYLPANCAVAVHIDLAAVAKNAAVNESFLPTVKAAFEKEKSEEADMAAFFTQTGLDPFADFHEVALCLTSIPKGGEDPTGMGVVTGSAKPGLLDALVKTSKKQDNFAPIEIGGNKGFEQDGVVLLQLADGALLAGNNKALVEAAVAAPGGSSAEFAAIGPATLRVIVPEETVRTGLSMPGSPFTSFAGKITGASSFSVNLDTPSITMRIATADEASATELAGVAKMLLTQVPKMPGDGIEAQMMAALAATDVKGEGTSLVATMTVPKAALMKGLTQMAGEVK